MNAFLQPRNFSKLFLVLSGLASVLELGPLFALARSDGLLLALAAGLAYQVGNLVAGSVSLPRWLVNAIAIASTLGLWVGIHGLTWVLLASVCGISIAIQKLRRWVQSLSRGANVPTRTKRAVRIMGFAVSGFLGLAGAVAVAVITAIVLVALSLSLGSQSWREGTKRQELSFSSLAGVMVLHQMHYFTYAYALAFILVSVFKIESLSAGVAFAVGWVSYASIESLIRSSNYVKVFLAGHGTVVVSLVLMALLSESAVGVLLCWFGSGLGGGTVYCLTRMNKAARSRRIELEPWEDWGHVLGVLLALIMVAVLDFGVFELFLTGASLAATAAVVLLLTHRQSHVGITGARPPSQLET